MSPVRSGWRAGRSAVALRLVALLLSLWTWDRVVVNCRGSSDSIAYYYFQATMRQGSWILCKNSLGQTVLCFQLLATPPVRFGPNISDPGTGTVVTTSFDPVAQPEFLPVPPVGGLAAWPWPTPDNSQPVVAVDFAQNSSKDVCQ